MRACAKVIARKLLRRSKRSAAALRALSGKLGFTYPRAGIRELALDRCVTRITTATALFHAARHSARICRLSCKCKRRRYGRDQQKERRAKNAQFP